MSLNMEKSTKMSVDFSMLPLDIQTYISNGVDSNKIGLISVRGDSMQPTIQHDGMVLIDTTNTTIINDCI